MYIPPDHYFWDFWIAPRRSSVEPYHLFHLQAPRSINHPEDRHWVASIGHAISFDLVSWTALPTAFEPAARPAWDDMAIWTGSVFDDGNEWHFFYTALSRAEEGRVQRIGLATSSDLTTWHRNPENPVLEADGRFLRKRSVPQWEWEAFRDPWVIRDPERNRYLMYMTASASDETPDGAGVVGLAESTDLLNWTALPSVTIPGDFGELEVPQIVQIGERWYLFFCTGKHSAARIERVGEAGRWIGTHYLVANSPKGPFREIADRPLVADKQGTYYAGRIVPGPGGNLVFMAWKMRDNPGAEFIGGLSNPAPLIQHPDGTLSVDASCLWT